MQYIEMMKRVIRLKNWLAVHVQLLVTSCSLVQLLEILKIIWKTARTATTTVNCQSTAVWLLNSIYWLCEFNNIYVVVNTFFQ